MDIWTIGVADRLRFLSFPSKPGRRGNARLRPHTHRRYSQQRIKIGEVNSRLVDPAAALTVIGAEIGTSRVPP